MPETNFKHEHEQIQTRDLIQLIRSAATDEDIPAVLIDFSSTSFAGPTTAINIAKELKALRESGKRVIAFNDHLSTASYLMASQASEYGFMTCWKRQRSRSWRIKRVSKRTI